MQYGPYIPVLISFTCFILICSAFFSLWKERAGIIVAHGPARPFEKTSDRGHWVDTWTAAPQSVDLGSSLPLSFAQEDGILVNTTIRQTVRVTIGAEQIRIRLSNAFGSNDLPITKVTIALPEAEHGENVTGSSGIDPSTLQKVSFSGDEAIVIPDGGLAVSDPINFSVTSGQVISINIYLAHGQSGGSLTSHRVSQATSWFVLGDHTMSANLPLTMARSKDQWYFISAIAAWKTPAYGAFVVIGDSISDGVKSAMNANAQWPNLLFDRMQQSAIPSLKTISITNQASAGNQELYDSKGGPNAFSRIDRDILAQSGVRYVMVFEGTNDIGKADANPETQAEIEERLIQYYKQTITRTHAFGIPVFGSTITPFACHDSPIKGLGEPVREQTRLRLNEWIRSSGSFDAIIDFDEVMRNPSNHTELAPLFDSGDCLHPNDAGYHQMAAKFPLDVFEKFKFGVDSFT